MNIKSNITLYKTPLDSEYRNVYDDYATQSDYVAFLENFVHTSISLATAQRDYSIKNTDEKFDLTIRGYNVDAISEYNYISFLTSNNKVYFAFILSIDSKNDNATYPTVTLHCKLDAWSNNYLTLKYDDTNGKPRSSTMINVSRATIDTYQMPNIPTPLKNASLTPKKQILRFIQSGSDKYVILWQRVVLSDAIDGVTYDRKPVVGNVATGSGIVIYRPAAILERKSNNQLDFVSNKTLRLIYYISTVATDSYDYTTNGLPMIAGVWSSVALSNTLCFSVPFYYYFDATNSTDSVLIFKIWDGEQCIACSTYGSKIAYNDTTIVTEEDVKTYGRWFTVIKYTEPYSPDEWRRKTKIINGVHPGVTGSTPYSTVAKNTVIEHSGIYTEYPFHYYSLYVGDKEIPIIGYNGNKFIDDETPDFPADYTPSYSQTPIPGCKTTISYEYAGKLGACLYIFNEGIDEFVRIPVETKSEMDIIHSAYDEYMMRNQASYTMNMASGIVSSLMGVGTSLATGNYVGAATGAISGTMSVLGQMASLEDKKNTANTVKSSGLYPQTSPYQLDLVLLVENSIPTEDIANTIEGNLIYDYHINGANLSMSLELCSVSRLLYDYSKGDVIFSAKIPDTDKKELVAAFSRGVYRFHIRRSASGALVRYTLLEGMDHRFINYPLSILP